MVGQRYRHAGEVVRVQAGKTPTCAGRALGVQRRPTDLSIEITAVPDPRQVFELRLKQAAGRVAEVAGLHAGPARRHQVTKARVRAGAAPMSFRTGRSRAASIRGIRATAESASCMAGILPRVWPRSGGSRPCARRHAARRGAQGLGSLHRFRLRLRFRRKCGTLACVSLTSERNAPKVVKSIVSSILRIFLGVD